MSGNEKASTQHLDKEHLTWIKRQENPNVQSIIEESTEGIFEERSP